MEEPLRFEALREHVRRIHEATGCNQRQTARLLGIARGRLVRHLAEMTSE